MNKKLLEKCSAKCSSKTLMIVNSLLLLVLVAVLSFNQFYITKAYKTLGLKNYFSLSVLNKLTNKAKTQKISNTGSVDLGLTGKAMDDAIKIAIGQGAPKIYGQEMNVSFDDVQASLDVMKIYDPDYGSNKLILSGDDLKRYINVALKISCEYCCGAKSIIRPDGKGACGCAHSQAMRGLLAYLIKNHNAEYTDDELLRELARWKAVYFPKQMIKKLAEQLQGINSFTPDTASLVIGLKLPDYGGKEVPLPSEIKDLPNMVGGC